MAKLAAVMSLPLISINNVTVRYLNNTLFNGLTLTIHKGKSWALIGKSGSGKSALLHTLAGRFNVTGGEIVHHFWDEHIKNAENIDPHLTHHKLIALVEPRHHFKNLSNTADFYYQQRYNSSDSEDALVVEDYLNTIKPVSDKDNYWPFEKV